MGTMSKLYKGVKDGKGYIRACKKEALVARKYQVRNFPRVKKGENAVTYELP